MTHAEAVDALERLLKGRAMNLNDTSTTISDVVHRMHSAPLDEVEACLIAAWLIAKGRATRPYAEIVATTRPMVGRSHEAADLAAVEAACF